MSRASALEPTVPSALIATLRTSSSWCSRRSMIMSTTRASPCSATCSSVVSARTFTDSCSSSKLEAVAVNTISSKGCSAKPDSASRIAHLQLHEVYSSIRQSLLTTSRSAGQDTWDIASTANIWTFSLLSSSCPKSSSTAARPPRAPSWPTMLSPATRRSKFESFRSFSTFSRVMTRPTSSAAPSHPHCSNNAELASRSCCSITRLWHSSGTCHFSASTAIKSHAVLH
mmetsp:Transcript_59305/g.133113  ORF Transcript_59305/g.133113 Transcript_59305/m.133113 type:complete len:228 (+) Transcript_59305:229-912(+)